MPKDIDKAVRLLQAASLADNVDAEVEYAIALYNGTGTPKNQAAGGGAVAQGRPAEHARSRRTGWPACWSAARARRWTRSKA